MTSTLQRLTSAVCPLCAAHRPLPPGITSPAFEDPKAPGIAPAEASRRQGILAAWVDPIQQLLAGECRAIDTGTHVGPEDGGFYPYAP